MTTERAIVPDKPAIVLAPMEGLCDAPMRAVQSEIGTFSFAVAEFVRISATVPPASVFYRQVPELYRNATTPCGLSVHVQLLGGHPERMAESALVACAAGARAIDINFGCPAPTVNTHDGGATLLKYPKRIREIVQAVRDAVPRPIPVSAKLRLGWDSEDAIFENAAMAAEGGADWLTIHARTRDQGYKPPVHWRHIGRVREQLGIPIVANGDIWTIAGFRRCYEETGCIHFMLGRGALADPFLSHRVASALHPDGAPAPPSGSNTPIDWRPYLQRLIDHTPIYPNLSSTKNKRLLLCRLKQWLKIANLCGNFPSFDSVKRAESVDDLFVLLSLYFSPTP